MWEDSEVKTQTSAPVLLSCPQGTILCLRVSFLSLFLLPKISNPHTPTLKHANLL